MLITSTRPVSPRAVIAASNVRVREPLGLEQFGADAVYQRLVLLLKGGRAAKTDRLDRGGGNPGLFGERGVRVPLDTARARTALS